MASEYDKGDRAIYMLTQRCTIVEKHLDDFPNHYYTVKMDDSGRERQTTSEKLSRDAFMYTCSDAADTAKAVDDVLISCNNCEDDIKAQWYCTDCKSHLCSSCNNAIHQLKVLKLHKRILIDALKKETSPDISKNIPGTLPGVDKAEEDTNIASTRATVKFVDGSVLPNADSILTLGSGIKRIGSLTGTETLLPVPLILPRIHRVSSATDSDEDSDVGSSYANWRDAGDSGADDGMEKLEEENEGLNLPQRHGIEKDRSLQQRYDETKLQKETQEQESSVDDCRLQDQRQEGIGAASQDEWRKQLQRDEEMRLSIEINRERVLLEMNRKRDEEESRIRQQHLEEEEARRQAVLNAKRKQEEIELRLRQLEREQEDVRREAAVTQKREEEQQRRLRKEQQEQDARRLVEARRKQAEEAALLRQQVREQEEQRRQSEAKRSQGSEAFRLRQQMMKQQEDLRLQLEAKKLQEMEEVRLRLERQELDARRDAEDRRKQREVEEGQMRREVEERREREIGEHEVRMLQQRKEEEGEMLTKREMLIEDATTIPHLQQQQQEEEEQQRHQHQQHQRHHHQQHQQREKEEEVQPVRHIAELVFSLLGQQLSEAESGVRGAPVPQEDNESARSRLDQQDQDAQKVLVQNEDFTQLPVTEASEPLRAGMAAAVTTAAVHRGQHTEGKLQQQLNGVDGEEVAAKEASEEPPQHQTATELDVPIIEARIDLDGQPTAGAVESIAANNLQAADSVASSTPTSADGMLHSSGSSGSSGSGNSGGSSSSSSTAGKENALHEHELKLNQSPCLGAPAASSVNPDDAQSSSSPTVSSPTPTASAVAAESSPAILALSSPTPPALTPLKSSTASTPQTSLALAAPTPAPALTPPESSGTTTTVSGVILSPPATIITFESEEAAAYSAYINRVLLNDKTAARHLPIKIDKGGEIFAKVGDGLILCQLVNLVRAKTINDLIIIKKATINLFQKTENINIALRGAAKLGCNVSTIDAKDVLDGKRTQILALLWLIIKAHLLSGVSVAATPELVAVKAQGEEAEAFAALSAESLLLRWVNFNLAKTPRGGGSARRVGNFSSEMQDGEALCSLLHALNPSACPAYNPAGDREERVRYLAISAAAVGVPDSFAQPQDILRGLAKLILGFVAQIFAACHGLPKVSEADGVAAPAPAAATAAAETPPPKLDKVGRLEQLASRKSQAQGYSYNDMIYRRPSGSGAALLSPTVVSPNILPASQTSVYQSENSNSLSPAVGATAARHDIVEETSSPTPPTPPTVAATAAAAAGGGADVRSADPPEDDRQLIRPGQVRGTATTLLQGGMPAEEAGDSVDGAEKSKLKEPAIEPSIRFPKIKDKIQTFDAVRGPALRPEPAVERIMHSSRAERLTDGTNSAAVSAAPPTVLEALRMAREEHERNVQKLVALFGAESVAAAAPVPMPKSASVPLSPASDVASMSLKSKHRIAMRNHELRSTEDKSKIVRKGDDRFGSATVGIVGDDADDDTDADSGGGAELSVKSQRRVRFDLTATPPRPLTMRKKIHRGNAPPRPPQWFLGIVPLRVKCYADESIYELLEHPWLLEDGGDGIAAADDGTVDSQSQSGLSLLVREEEIVRRLLEEYRRSLAASSDPVAGAAAAAAVDSDSPDLVDTLDGAAADGERRKTWMDSDGVDSEGVSGAAYAAYAADSSAAGGSGTWKSSLGVGRFMERSNSGQETYTPFVAASEDLNLPLNQIRGSSSSSNSSNSNSSSSRPAKFFAGTLPGKPDSYHSSTTTTSSDSIPMALNPNQTVRPIKNSFQARENGANITTPANDLQPLYEEDSWDYRGSIFKGGRLAALSNYADDDESSVGAMSSISEVSLGSCNTEDAMDENDRLDLAAIRTALQAATNDHERSFYESVLRDFSMRMKKKKRKKIKKKKAMRRKNKVSQDLDGGGDVIRHSRDSAQVGAGGGDDDGASVTSSAVVAGNSGRSKSDKARKVRFKSQSPGKEVFTSVGGYVEGTGIKTDGGDMRGQFQSSGGEAGATSRSGLTPEVLQDDSGDSVPFLVPEHDDSSSDEDLLSETSSISMDDFLDESYFSAFGGDGSPGGSDESSRLGSRNHSPHTSYTPHWNVRSAETRDGTPSVVSEYGGSDAPGAEGNAIDAGHTPAYRGDVDRLEGSGRNSGDLVVTADDTTDDTTGDAPGDAPGDVVHVVSSSDDADASSSFMGVMNRLFAALYTPTSVADEAAVGVSDDSERPLASGALEESAARIDSETDDGQRKPRAAENGERIGYAGDIEDMAREEGDDDDDEDTFDSAMLDDFRDLGSPVSHEEEEEDEVSASRDDNTQVHLRSHFDAEDEGDEGRDEGEGRREGGEGGGDDMWEDTRDHYYSTRKKSFDRTLSPMKAGEAMSPAAGTSSPAQQSPFSALLANRGKNRRPDKKKAGKILKRLEPMVDKICTTPNCGKLAGMACPTCRQLGLSPSLFCNQDCFRGNWSEHKVRHIAGDVSSTLRSPSHWFMCIPINQ